ncbi:unnamed protein product [Hermetia illucens]|uniref:PBZ-type domain-containing protein n=1 Tax=Hermetia illucens TaxID=343691 RepID=A0A7R8V396_HERIL|nr:probable tyrosyl-DNA phosphodiesterase [Hermetia illucens]CAD7091212.1 unnamed protein product [Hermetia illucens]
MRKARKPCQYGEDCYRKNPNHFAEYSHPHLEKILSKGKDKTTRTYTIPSDLFLSKDVIMEQLQILEKLNLNDTSQPRKVANEESSKQQPKEKEAPPKNTHEQQQSERQKPLPGPSASSSRSESSSTSSSNHHLETREQRRSRSRSPIQSNASSSQTSQADGSRLSKKPRIDKNIHDYISVVLPKGQMAKKLEKAAPYNFFLTTITDSKPTHNEPLSITLQEILDQSLGELESSVQINFMVDIGWLLGHYYFAGCLDTPLLVLYGDETPELRTISQHKPQVTAVKVQMNGAFAIHHTKMMLLGYKDGSMRVVVSTANLYEDDWHNRTQGLWISPTLKPLPENVDTATGESPTGFRNDLMLYLVEYKISKLQPWIARIRKTDFSSVNVFLVASASGGFRETPRGHPWGHARLGSLLSKHCPQIDETCPVIAQSSSIGSLGPTAQNWIYNDFVNSLRRDTAPLGIRRMPPFKMIYPSFENVKNSHDGMLGGGCLPYSQKNNEKQPWLKAHLHQWKAKGRHRDRAMPHIKTYFRYSEKGLHWFVLTSANLSKAAWGAFNKNVKIEPVLRIFNYEAGVLFLPKFVIGKDVFPLDKVRDGDPPFPMPHDLPPTPYASDDFPFVMDFLVS